MRQYQQTLEKLGLTFETVSNGLKDQIKKFEKAEKEYAEMQEDFATVSTDDENYEMLKEQLNDYKKSLEEGDEIIAEKIEKYFEKKDFYDAKMQYMKDKKAGLQSGESPKAGSFKKPQAPAQAAPQPALQPAPQPTQVAATGAATAPAKPEPITVVAEEVKEKKKGGDNWVLWGILALIGIGVGVNVMRNRD